MQRCPSGSYCIHGLKVPCPSGLICDYGVKPNPCFSYSKTGTYTCFNEGHSRVQQCPNSAYCNTTQTEPILAPPSYYMNIKYYTSDRDLKECKNGDYCNLGRFAFEEGMFF